MQKRITLLFELEQGRSQDFLKGGGGGGGGVVTEATHQIVMSTSTLKTRAVDENTLQKNKF